MKVRSITSGALCLFLAAFACGDDNDEPADAGQKDAGDSGSGDTDSVERGKYLVESLGACADCHTPRTANGSFDQSRALAGVDCFIDADPTKDDFGCLSTGNLTNHETGLKKRRDQEIMDLFMKGERPDGKYLHPVMPYYVLGNMSQSDAEAIVAYLRTVKGVDHMVEANQAPFMPPEKPAPVVPKDKLPKPSADYKDKTAAMRGMYLAANFGICMECHSPRDDKGQVLVDKLFQGNNRFGRDELGLPPAFPEAIYSTNLTPHETGIKDWSVDDIVDAIKKGQDKDKKPLCPPMPAGPMGAFGGITDSDARDIAHYLLSLPPKDNMITAKCDVPM